MNPFVKWFNMEPKVAASQLQELMAKVNQIQLALDKPVFSSASQFGIVPDTVKNRDAILRRNDNWLWVASDKIAKFIMNSPYAIYRETSQGEEMLDNKHFLYSHIENPTMHPIPQLRMRRSKLWYLTNQARFSVGDAYWYCSKNGLGLPAEYHFLFPEYGRMSAKKNDYAEIIGWELSTSRGGQPIQFAPDEIIHFNYPTINNSTYGKSPGMAMANLHELDNQMKVYYNNMMANGGFGSVVFTSEKTVSASSKEQFLQKFQSDRAGYQNSGHAWFADNGVTVEPLGYSPKDFESNSFLNLTRDQMMQAYGLTKSVFGGDEDVNRASAEAGIYVASLFVFQPSLDMFGEDLTYGCLKQYDDYAYLKFDSVIPRDEKLNAEINEVLIRSGQRTPDECRIDQEKQPYQNGIGSHPMSTRNAARLEDVVNKDMQNFFAQGQATQQSQTQNQE